MNEEHHHDSPHTERVKPSWKEAYLGAGEPADGKIASWGAIFAGTVTGIAVLLLFSLLGVATGLGIIEPTSNDPFDNLGIGLGIWAVVTLVVSLAAGGFVTGVLARRAGFIHGVVTWATSLILAAALLSWGAASALGAAGQVIGSTASALGSGAQSVASGAGNALEGATEPITDALGEVDQEEVTGEMEEVLVGTDIEELQPEYLQDQFTEAGDEVLTAGQDLLVNPEDSDQILADLSDSLTQRAETIGEAVDEEAIANSVEQNTDLTGAEADELAQNTVSAVENTSSAAQEQIGNAEAAIEDVSSEVEAFIADAREAAEEASDTGAKAAGWGFAGLLVSLVITAFAGLFGARVTDTRRGGSKVVI